MHSLTLSRHSDLISDLGKHAFFILLWVVLKMNEISIAVRIYFEGWKHGNKQ